MKKGIALFLCLIFAVMSFAMAAASEEDAAAADNELVISAGGEDFAATVNGVEISMQEFEETVNEALWSYGLTLDTMEEQYGADMITDFKNDVLDMLIQREALFQEATARGLDELSEEEQELVEQYAAEHLEYLEYYIDSGITTGSTEAADGEELDTEGLYEAYLEEYGIDQESVEYIYYVQEVVGKLYDEIYEGIEPSDDDIQNYYDTAIEEHMQSEEEDADAAFEHYLSGEHSPELYVPQSVAEQAKYVKHILFSIPDETQEEIYALSLDGDDAGANELLEQALAELLPAAQEVLEKAQAGEDFDALIEEYNEDPGMETETDGYLVYEGAGYVESFLNAAMELEEVGDIYPEPVESDYGYHIIRYESQPVAGAVPLEDVSAEIYDLLKQEMTDEAWNALAEELVANADVVKAEIL